MLNIDSRAIEPTLILPEQLQEDRSLPPGEVVSANNYFVVAHFYGWSFHAPEQGLDEEGNRIELPPEWLPDVKRVNYTPGANGVGEHRDPTTKKSVVTPGLARAGASSKGILIEPGDRRLGKQWGHYVAAYPVRGGGNYHCYKWVAFSLVSGGKTALPNRPHNTTQTRAFLRHLYRSGIVPLMGPDVLDTKIAIRRARLAVSGDLFRNGKIDGETMDRLTRECEAEVQLWQDSYRRLIEQSSASDRSASTLSPQAAIDPSGSL